MILVGCIGVHVVRFTHTKHAPLLAFLTNVVGIRQSKGFVKEKIPLSLEAMAVCFSESVGELF